MFGSAGSIRVDALKPSGSIHWVPTAEYSFFQVRPKLSFFFRNRKLNCCSMADDEKRTYDPKNPRPAVDAIVCTVLGCYVGPLTKGEPGTYPN